MRNCSNCRPLATDSIDLTHLHDRDVVVTACGRICMHRKRVNISTVLAGQRVGISPGGWGGIRTHGGLAPSPDFKSGAFDRSATHPELSAWKSISEA